jgi:phosphoribosylanthranilate isomerase
VHLDLRLQVGGGIAEGEAPPVGLDQLQAAAAQAREGAEDEPPRCALGGVHGPSLRQERLLAWISRECAYPWNDEVQELRVKVCGMTNLADAEHAASLGAWAVGLIHHPESPRYVEPAVAEEIGAALKRSRVEIAGVFVNSSLEEVVDAAERENLTLLQFHGEEGPQFCTEAARRTGAKVMKAMRVTSAADVQAAETFRTDFHLFDAYFHGLHGGTGKSFDWGLVAKRKSKVPMVLAGGLTPENVAEAIELVRPYAVDVVSGVEAEPGIKDHAKVEAFLAAAGVEKPEAVKS